MEKKYAALRKALAAELRALRRHRAGELSQRAFSEKVGMDVGGLERGERLPAISILWELAEAFEISPSRLVARIDQRYRLEGGAAPPPLLPPGMKYLRKFMDQLPTMKWLADRQQNCVYANRPLLDYLGLTLDQITGQAGRELLHPEDRGCQMALMGKAYRRRQPCVSRFRVRRADGQYAWVVQQSDPQFTTESKFIGFLGTMIPEPLRSGFGVHGPSGS